MQGWKMKDQNATGGKYETKNAELEMMDDNFIRWKMKDQEEATLYQSHQLNRAACFKE